MTNQVDVVMLQHIAAVLRKDVADGYSGINAAAMTSIASRIERAIGDPLLVTSTYQGMHKNELTICFNRTPTDDELVAFKHGLLNKFYGKQVL